jgi:putative FmdB family regulatory protein
MAFFCSSQSREADPKGPSPGLAEVLQSRQENIVMPRYVFFCEACKEEFTEVMHIDDLGKVKVKCPKCGAETVHQEVSTFAAVTSKKS